LVIIPTILLSMGMLMFFTLGSSMVGDICDEDELQTGTRSEGSYYSVFWWFIKMGTAFASFVTGALLVATNFNESQSKLTAELYGGYEIVLNEAKTWANEGQVDQAETSKERLELWLNEKFGEAKDLSLHTTASKRLPLFNEQITETLARANKFALNLEESNPTTEADQVHIEGLANKLAQVIQRTEALKLNAAAWVEKPDALKDEVEDILHASTALSQQTPKTLLSLRIFEIGLPLVLSVFSILLTLRYPLTEERCYEIKAELDARKKHEATT
jgi:GPH family glycoside/pentoside/hexuronide:cation symporter